ncbi:uncharacterized protein [Polyergus mexicanus]|uniref:uncharacterized protein n=1 Tax=Polyergus mexicanus TaxID=615972 RepID=UPI0038B437DF
MENQDLITTDETTKKELETIKYVSIMQADNANGDNVYLQNTSNSTNPGNEAIQNWEDKRVHYEERCPIGNEAYKQDEVTANKIVIDKINTEVINKRIRRSNRLLVNDKKENLKTTICGKVLKQKRTTRKSSKTAQNTISNEMLTMLYKKLESEKYEKSMLPSFGSIRPNNINNTLHIPYGIAKQEELHYNYSSNNRNMLQYLDYNNLRHENLKQPILINSNPWSVVPKNEQNFILNNITNTQNQVGQTGFINDNQYQNTYIAADYNSKQNENPYFHSSIKSTDSRQLFGTENKVFRCSCNVCTSNMWNNMQTGVEVFPKKENATVQQIANNNILSYIPTTVTANDTWNTAVGSFNYLPNYQPLQADYNFKRLFYSGFNTMNNVNNSGYNVMARRNIMSPLNNWNPQINHLTFPYNSNTNVILDASVSSEPLPSSSLYTGNSSTQFSNYYNKDLVKADMSQYKEKDNFNPSTISSFENSLPTTNTHKLNFESTHTSSQNSTSTNDSGGVIYDITNFISETNTPNGSQESPSYVYAKEMDKNWSSNLPNI